GVLAAEDVVWKQREPIYLIPAHPMEVARLLALAELSADDFTQEEDDITLVDVAVGIGADARRVGVDSDQPNDSRLQPRLLARFPDAAAGRRFADVHPAARYAPVGPTGPLH